MPIESAIYIDTLTPDWPLGTDPESAGDDHLRMIKKVLKNTFPNINAGITGTPDQINNITLNTPWLDNSATAGALSYFKLTDKTKTDGTQAALSLLTPTLAQYTATPTLAVTWEALQDYFYPIGSEYKSYTDNRNPNAILGFGTWVAVTGVLAGVGLATGEDGNQFTYKVGAAGFGHVRHSDLAAATYTVTLTMDAVAPHSHNVPLGHSPGKYVEGTGDSGSGWWIDGTNTPAGTGGGHTPTGKGSVSVGTATTTYAPTYYGAYVWRRTA